jgi:hypothetical protein
MLVAFSVLAVVITAVSVSIFAAPGTTDDPIVSLSYIEQRLNQMKQYVDVALAEIDPNAVPSSRTFTVVSVNKGQKLIAGEGTELIIRQGKAKIIATKKGGIADTTTGYDLPNGTDAPSNELLIVPVADGRGLNALEDMLVMVKGSYNIQ